MTDIFRQARTHGCASLDVGSYGGLPHRYSMNAILYESYYTIHVTPGESFSYASFETNHPFESYRCEQALFMSRLLYNLLRKLRRFALCFQLRVAARLEC